MKYKSQQRMYLRSFVYIFNIFNILICIVIGSTIILFVLIVAITRNNRDENCAVILFVFTLKVARNNGFADLIYVMYHE